MPGGPAGLALAREALEVVAGDLGATDPRRAVGTLRFLDEGLWSAVYSGTLSLPDGSRLALVAKLPLDAAAPERDEVIRREARLLRALEPLALPFRVPRALAELPAVTGLVAVQEQLSGMALDLRAANTPVGRPWEIVARVAAGLHALDPLPFREMLPGPRTRREHASAFAGLLDRIDGPDGDEARAWVAAHLPPPDPSSVLHGDLTSQNLLLPIKDEPIGVIDWGEATPGDPAFDLAIVTRGARQPFGLPDGLARLLESYNALAPRPVEENEVRLYEIVLRAGLYLDVVDQRGAGSAHAAAEREGFRAMLRRAVEAAR